MNLKTLSYLPIVLLLTQASQLKLTRIELTPDLMQTDVRAKLPYGGKPHCGPVAASNAMIFLANKGYPKLSNSKNPTKLEQGKIVQSIAKCMNTTRSMGTTENGFLNGLTKYITSKGYKIKTLKYQGWQKVESSFDSGIKKPNPQSILSNLDDKSQVFLKIGWYKHQTKNNQYIRFAGHWVCVVKAYRTKNGIEVVIHDSAPRSGPHKSSDKVNLAKLSSGTIVSGWTKPFSASGMYSMGKELKIKKKADFGILDGMIILKLQ